MTDRGKNIHTVKNAAHASESSNLPFAIGIGILAGLSGCLLLTLLFSAILSAQENPMLLLPYMADAALFAGGFLSGFTAAKLYRYSMAGSLFSGIGCIVVLTVLSLFIGGENRNGMGIYIGCGLAFLCSVLGSIAAKPSKRSVRSSSPTAIVRKTRQKYSRI